MPAVLIFPTAIANDQARKGQLAAPKQTFGENRRFAVAPLHTRFDAVEWFVWDANVYADENGMPDVIRQESTLDAAIAGLGGF